MDSSIAKKIDAAFKKGEEEGMPPTGPNMPQAFSTSARITLIMTFFWSDIPRLTTKSRIPGEPPGGKKDSSDLLQETLVVFAMKEHHGSIDL